MGMLVIATSSGRCIGHPPGLRRRVCRPLAGSLMNPTLLTLLLAASSLAPAVDSPGPRAAGRAGDIMLIGALQGELTASNPSDVAPTGTAPAPALSGRAARDESSPARLTDFCPPAEAAAIDQRIAHDLAQVSASRLRKLLAELTAKPHVAGTPRSREIAGWVAGQFRAAGMKAAIDGYRVLLSYPRRLELDLIAPTPVRIDLSEPESEFDPLAGHGEFPPYNAYSGSGDVAADLVFAGFGRQEDYVELARRGVSVRDRIVIARLGRLFRGTKVRIAEEHGAAGMILFSDPAEDGAAAGPVFPAGVWRPEWAIQRGSVPPGTSFGDPATPRYPSPPATGAPPFVSDPLPLSAMIGPPPLTYAAAAAKLPQIPVISISAANAARLLAHLGGPEAPKPWCGALSLTYRIGPGPAKVRLLAEMELRDEDIWNAIGWLPGEETGLLLAGCHHDAWDYGAVDSGSGLVATLEAARVLGAAAGAGWRPRRTLMLTAWDGEEFGLIGSTEFAERYSQDLARRVVAVINLDGAVGGAGGAISASGSPQLAAWIELAADRVPNPLEPGTLRSAWLRQEPEPGRHRPIYSFLPASSDHAAFAVDMGIPAVAFGVGEEFGVYHSTLDNFQWVARLGDPDLLWHRVLTQWLVAAIEIAGTTPRLPIVLTNYADALEDALADLTEGVRAAKDDALARQLAETRAAAAEWRLACQQFDERGRMGVNVPADMALWNEIASGVDRRFIVEQGLQSHAGPRHLLVAPGERTGAGRALMPTLDEDLKTGDLASALAKLERLQTLLRVQSASLHAYLDR